MSGELCQQAGLSEKASEAANCILFVVTVNNYAVFATYSQIK